MTPIESAWLRDVGCPIARCPNCGDEPFEPFLRGQVQRGPWAWWDIFHLRKPRPYCAVICARCKELVGYEGANLLEMP